MNVNQTRFDVLLYCKCSMAKEVKQSFFPTTFFFIKEKEEEGNFLIFK